MRLLRPLTPVLDLLLPPTCAAGGTGDVTLNLSTSARDQTATLAMHPCCPHRGLPPPPYQSPARENICPRSAPPDVDPNPPARVGRFSEPPIPLLPRLKFSRAWEIAPILAPFL